MWFNTIVRTLLRSPLHFFMSEHTLLMTYRGRRSGRLYTTPMNYVRDGDGFYITSLRTHTWWRNLRNGIPVELTVQGKKLRAHAEVVEGVVRVATELEAYFQLAPSLAARYGVKWAGNGALDAQGVAEAARKLVVVKAELARSEENGAKGNKQTEKLSTH